MNKPETTKLQQPTSPAAAAALLEPEPMDPQVTSIQPGGGVVVRMELAWGHLRRWYLKTFRRGYVARMKALRQGEFNPCPHEVLDSRDLKFFRNQGGYYWRPEDDPFTWRDRLPFARVGLAELLVFTAIFFGASVGFLVGLLNANTLSYRLAWGVPMVAMFICGLLVMWFFRNPKRTIPTEPGLVISPADGTLVTIEEVEHDEFIGGPAVLIGIFLSIFNVHINRAATQGKVIAIRYRKGKFLNALRPESARENEQLALLMQSTEAPYRKTVTRQITGAIARRIVCWMKPGDVLERGQQLGMIKFGSRTELVIPKESGLKIEAHIGQHLKAGKSILARYTTDNSPPH